VRYRLEYRESARTYLRDLRDLTREGRVKVNAVIIERAAEATDAFRADPDNRPSPDSPFFHFTHFFDDAGRTRMLYVAVDDTTAAFGVLRVVYAECR
jgi:hypothetical protein